MHIQTTIEQHRRYLDCLCFPKKGAQSIGVNPLFPMIQRFSECLRIIALNCMIGVSEPKYIARDIALLDTMNLGCSKGRALKFWTTQQGIAPHEVMAMGDNFNDLEMLEFPPPITDPERLNFERGLGIPLIRTLVDNAVFVRLEKGTSVRMTVFGGPLDGDDTGAIYMDVSSFSGLPPLGEEG